MDKNANLNLVNIRTVLFKFLYPFNGTCWDLKLFPLTNLHIMKFYKICYVILLWFVEIYNINKINILDD